MKNRKIGFKLANAIELTFFAPYGDRAFPYAIETLVMSLSSERTPEESDHRDLRWQIPFDRAQRRKSKIGRARTVLHPFARH